MSFRKIIIFGCGKGGERAMKTLSKDESLVAFCDNDPEKQGSIYHKHPVISPIDIPKKQYDLVLIASQYSEAICHQLINIGIQENSIEIVSIDTLTGKAPKRKKTRKWLIIIAATLLGFVLALVRIWKTLCIKLRSIA